MQGGPERALPFFCFIMLEKLVGKSCRLCPRECGVDRNIQRGICKTGNKLKIASFNLHYGEEPPISGKNGSGTIFFVGCNMSCIYCQNYPISQLVKPGREVSSEELADIMIKLQKRGAHNINLVTPSHFVHLIVDSIKIARNKGLAIPIVYNTSSYDKEDVVLALNEYVDVYLADLKYVDRGLSRTLSGVENYFEVASRALLAMYKTKGKLELENGIAKKGLIVRHLVLPNALENTRKALEWIKHNLSGVSVSVMFQYFPAYKALSHPSIGRKVNLDEYLYVCDLIDRLELDGFIQQI